MRADVSGLRVPRIESDEGPALGVAILAMVGAGIYPSVKEACDAIVRQKDVTACDAERNARYGQFYKVYTALYPHLKADFDALAEL
jgi:xylulokinase